MIIVEPHPDDFFLSIGAMFLFKAGPFLEDANLITIFGNGTNTCDSSKLRAFIPQLVSVRKLAFFNIEYSVKNYLPKNSSLMEASAILVDMYGSASYYSLVDACTDILQKEETIILPFGVSHPAHILCGCAFREAAEREKKRQLFFYREYPHGMSSAGKRQTEEAAVGKRLHASYCITAEKNKIIEKIFRQVYKGQFIFNLWNRYPYSEEIYA
jgi:hypothetical protein